MGKSKPSGQSSAQAPTIGANGSGLPSISDALGSGLISGAGTQSLSGTASVNLNTEVMVPATPLSNIGMTQMTIKQYIASLGPRVLDYQKALEAAGYTPTDDTTTLGNELADMLYQASQATNVNGQKGVDITSYLNSVVQQRQALQQAGQLAQTGSAHFYKGATTEVNISTPQDVAAAVDQIWQQYAGRHAPQAAITSVLAQLNSQEYAKGAVDVATNQQQQIGMAQAWAGGASGPTLQSSAQAYAGTDLGNFMAAIKQHESGGNYSAQNGDSGARGAYQIMPSNWSSWAQAAGLPADAPWTQQNQDLVAAHQMQQLYNDLGNWGAVAVAWYAGESAAKQWLQNPNASQFTAPQGGGKYPSINDYVAQVGNIMGGTASLGGSSTAASGAGGAVNTPGGTMQSGTPSQNQIPTLTALAPGQSGASETVGQPYSFQQGSSTFYVTPPTASIVAAPATADEQAFWDLTNNHSQTYQAHNLLNVFSVIHQMLGGAATNKTGPLQTPVNMP